MLCRRSLLGLCAALAFQPARASVISDKLESLVREWLDKRVHGDKTPLTEAVEKRVRDSPAKIAAKAAIDALENADKALSLFATLGGGAEGLLRFFEGAADQTSAVEIAEAFDGIEAVDKQAIAKRGIQLQAAITTLTRAADPGASDTWIASVSDTVRPLLDVATLNVPLVAFSGSQVWAAAMQQPLAALSPDQGAPPALRVNVDGRVWSMPTASLADAIANQMFGGDKPILVQLEEGTRRAVLYAQDARSALTWIRLALTLLVEE